MYYSNPICKSYKGIYFYFHVGWNVGFSACMGSLDETVGTVLEESGVDFGG
jgi:hypothetical protein